MVFFFIIAAIASIFSEHYLFPRLSSVEFFSKNKLFKNLSQDVVVVNKTEQVTVNEGQSIVNYLNNAQPSIVEVISQRKSDSGANAQVVESKVGSGVILTADGIIATYQSAVIQDGSVYKIITSDGTSYDAELVMADKFSNITFLRAVGANNLPTVSFIAPEDIKVGSKIIVAGKNGYNAYPSYQTGIISEQALSYSLAGPLASSDKLQGVLFIDSNISKSENPTLSGGEVVDYNGDLVGILGFGNEIQNPKSFVVPVNHIQYLLDQYLKEGSIKRATLGIYYIPLTLENSYLTNGEYSKGALVYSASRQQGLAVISGSPADKAGLKIMDLITSVNDEEVDLGQNLALLISKYKSGDTVKLKTIRDGKEMEIKVTLE
ncbi:MAG: S1C family serine protease [Parcubacteria group bacterium]